jgi:hypothetical protein
MVWESSDKVINKELFVSSSSSSAASEVCVQLQGRESEFDNACQIDSSS